MNLYKKEENLPAKSLDTGTKPLQKSRAAYRRIFMSTKGGESFIWRKVSRAKLLCRKPMEILWRSNDCTIPRCYLCQQIRGLVLTSLNHRNTRVYTTCPSYNTRVPSQKSFMLYERMWLQETKLKHTRKERERKRDWKIEWIDKGGAMLESPVTCSPILIHLLVTVVLNRGGKTDHSSRDMGQSYPASFAYIGQANGWWRSCDAVHRSRLGVVRNEEATESRLSFFPIFVRRNLRFSLTGREELWDFERACCSTRCAFGRMMSLRMN